MNSAGLYKILPASLVAASFVMLVVSPHQEYALSLMLGVFAFLGEYVGSLMRPPESKTAGEMLMLHNRIAELGKEVESLRNMVGVRSLGR